MDAMVPKRDDAVNFELKIVDMFRKEWRLNGRAKPLTTIAIIDEGPEEQYLYP